MARVSLTSQASFYIETGRDLFMYGSYTVYRQTAGVVVCVMLICLTWSLEKAKM